MAKRVQQKKKNPQPKVDETQDEVAENDVEDESDVDSDVESGADNLAEDFEEDGESEAEAVPDIEVTGKDQAVRILEVRRAIEERMEQRKFKDDLDYLDEEM